MVSRNHKPKHSTSRSARRAMALDTFTHQSTPELKQKHRRKQTLEPLDKLLQTDNISKQQHHAGVTLQQLHYVYMCRTSPQMNSIQNGFIDKSITSYGAIYRPPNDEEEAYIERCSALYNHILHALDTAKLRGILFNTLIYHHYIWHIQYYMQHLSNIQYGLDIVDGELYSWRMRE